MFITEDVAVEQVPFSQLAFFHYCLFKIISLILLCEVVLEEREQMLMLNGLNHHFYDNNTQLNILCYNTSA